MLKAVIFDLGGTLMSFGDPALTFRELTWIGLEGLHAHLCGRDGAALPSKSDFCATVDQDFERAWPLTRTSLRSTRLDELLSAALAHWHLSLTPTETDEALSAFHATMQPYIHLYEDTIETLDCLKARGLKIGLISNTIWRPAMHDKDLERCGILGYFDHRLYSSAFRYVKPHPAIFRHSVEALGVRPEEALFVGDRIWDDVGGAQSAGLKAVLKVVPEREEASEQIVPDARVRSLRELCEILDSFQ